MPGVSNRTEARLAYSANIPSQLSQTAQALSGRIWYLAALAAGCAVLGLAVPDRVTALAFLSGAGVLGMLTALVAILSRRGSEKPRPARELLDMLAGFLDHDAAPTFCTDADGVVRYRNGVAGSRFSVRGGDTLAKILGEVIGNAAAVIFRLQERAEAHGRAREDVVTRRGHIRLSAHWLGEEGVLWRVEDMVEREDGETTTVSLPMLTVSKTGTVLYMNEPLRRLLGARVKHIDRVFDDLPLRPDGVHHLTSVNGPLSVRVTAVDGPGGRQELFLAPCDDEELSGATTRRFFDELPVALVKLSVDGTVQMANRMARELLGHSMNGSVHLDELVEGLGRSITDWLADAVQGRTLRKPEIVHATRAETEVYLQIMLHRIVEDGEVSLVAVLNDATELKTLEAQFVQSQKMQAIGQLAGGVAHDFNNLLTAISGHCDLLLLRHDQGDPDYAELQQINQNANRAASLVAQLLAFSRKQNLQPEILDLRDTLADLGHLLNRLVGERVRLTLRHDPDLRPIRADKRQLEQVIMNLVVNARDAMSDGGEIRIETENVALTETLHRDRASLAKGDYVMVRVTDDGAGIAGDKLQKIFEPFYTTKRTGEGTGLGLSTAYGIVKQTGGYIFVDSTLGVGTIFTLYFPAHEAPAIVHAAPVEDDAADLNEPGDGVILLVEDEAPVRAFAARALRMRGYTVVEAENAEDALAQLEDPDLTVDMFVSDVIMPGMDGPTWVRKALEDRPDARVVFVSGYAEDSVAEHQAKIPNAVFLPKPFSLNDLTGTVHRQFQ